MVLAGREYVEALRGTAMGHVIEAPLAGLQIGERLQWLARNPAPTRQPELFGDPF